MKLSEKIFKERNIPLVKATMFNQVSGYDVDSTELFLEEIGIAAESLEKENERLREEVKIAMKRKEVVDIDTSETQATREEVAAHVSEPLNNMMTQQQGVNQLKEEYEERVETLDVRERAMKRMLIAAEEETKLIKREAQEQASKIIQEAQEKATQLLTEINLKYKEKENELIILDNSKYEMRERLLNIRDFITNIVEEQK